MRKCDKQVCIPFNVWSMTCSQPDYKNALKKAEVRDSIEEVRSEVKICFDLVKSVKHILKVMHIIHGWVPTYWSWKSWDKQTSPTSVVHSPLLPWLLARSFWITLARHHREVLWNTVVSQATNGRGHSLTANCKHQQIPQWLWEHQ